ncbi:MAG: hypothetical protein WBP64_14085 [Nitrososphaeraceae archaeon]
MDKKLHTYQIKSIENLYNIAKRSFALCDSCLWSATIFEIGMTQELLSICPSCLKDNLSLIPLAINEYYDLLIKPKGGLEINFKSLAKNKA